MSGTVGADLQPLVASPSSARRLGAGLRAAWPLLLLPRRWVVERTFGWLNHSRRLSKSYERLTRMDEAWIYIAMTRIMLERLA